MATLPLFPLGTVLVPGARLPLQIFEPRYVSLLKDLVEAQDERPPVFGVIAIREGHEVGELSVRELHVVGCGAQLAQVASLGGNRFLIIAVGTDRFRLNAVDPTAETPYVTADVTWLPEVEGDAEVVADLARRLRAELAAFRSLVAADEDALPDDASGLSYAVAQQVPLELADRQYLLECPDTESRLHLALRLVHRERELAASLGSVTIPYQPPHLG